jgi:hypothetical protein
MGSRSAVAPFVAGGGASSFTVTMGEGTVAGSLAGGVGGGAEPCPFVPAAET